EVHYHRQSRAAGETKYPLRKMLRLASDAILSSSRLPLCLPYLLAALAVLGGIAGLVVIPAVPAGPSYPVGLLFGLVLFCAAAQLISIGVLGEYLGRVFSQVQQRPLFIVQEATDPPPESGVDLSVATREKCCSAF
ncbi:MAG: hypothetical protein ABI614_26695, partial [Planctomycetota bacterium]